jgi:Family of unknown function (DUF6328)
VPGELPATQETRVELSLVQAAEYLLQECRMVLPGMQALFGFQLIAVFNPGFAQKLSPFEQRLHLLAIALVAVAVSLIMTPAAYHRQARPYEVTETLLTLASRFVLWSMWPLALGISLDFYLIAQVILNHALVPLLAVGLFAIFALCWFVLPRAERLQWAVTRRRL